MEEVTKTGYEWCLEANIRLLNFIQWGGEQSYFTDKISAKEFYQKIENCSVKPNSQPRKTDIYLEYRMYGLVAYQLSGTIHAGIQFGHAVVDYSLAMATSMSADFTKYYKWAKEDKTFIILNGGTTNTNLEKLGTLNKHLSALREANVIVQDFYEPDLGDQLTAICFIVDERVFNREVYPDFVKETLPWSRKKPSEKEVSILEAKNNKNYESWVEKIGGPTNAFLRDYLRPLKLS